MAPKLPRRHIQPAPTKTPKVASEPDDWYRKFPAWKIGRIEFAEPWGRHELNAEGVREIHRKLSSFETMTWREILSDSGKQNHFIGVWQICTDAQERLEKLGYGTSRGLFHFDYPVKNAFGA
jgi:hypothetical protein